MKKLSHQIRFLFIVLIPCYGKMIHKIKLNGVPLTENVVTLNVSMEYKLDCESVDKIKWMKMSAINDEIVDLDKTVKYLENEKYHSILYIQAASVHNVSTYLCTISNYPTFKHEEQMAIELGDKLHIFVKDTEQPLAPSADYNLTVWQYSEAIIPCKPSYIPLRIELLRENNSSLGVPYTYNDTIGYKIHMFYPFLNGTALICRTRIENQDFSHKFHLKIVPYERFVIKPEIQIVSQSNNYIKQGDGLTLSCSVVVPKNIHYEMKWMSEKLNGLLTSRLVTITNVTKMSHPDSAELQIGIIQLIIKFMTNDDSDLYFCQVYDESINSNYKAEMIWVSFEMEPAARMERAQTRIMHDQNATIVCYNFSSTIGITVEFFYMLCNPKHPWNCSNERFDLHNLSIQNVVVASRTRSSTMIFKPSGPCNVQCVASDELGVRSAITRVWIDDQSEDYVINKTSFQEPIWPGDNVTLTCAAKSSLYESLQWYQNDERNFSGNVIKITELNFTYSLRTELHFHNITVKQSGTYECRVENGTGVFNKSVEIRVEEYQKPNIQDTNLSVRKMVRSVGESLELRCNFSGKPTPNITWFKNGAELAGKNGSDSISIRKITADDFGTYECVVRNKVGEAAEIVNIVTGFRLDLTLGIIALIAIVVACIIFLVIRERNHRKDLKAAGLDNFELGAIVRINPDLPLDEQAEFLAYNKKFEFPKNKLKLGRQLGAGAFGVVLQAIAHQIYPEEEETVVAVKVVHKMADNDVMKALVSELKIMANLGRHLNIVNLLGAVTKNIAKRDLMIILEYCPFGNLQDHLQKNRSNFVNQFDPETKQLNPEITQSLESQGAHYENMTALNLILNYFNPEPESESKVSTTNLIAWAFQIARGMEYLASRRVLHGDLAARNVLLCEQNIVKLSDFGLSRSLYRNSVYKKEGSSLLPVRWLAPESIGENVFGTFSDVWSFGIVMWELFSLAMSPYPGMELNEGWFLRIKDGFRMDKPEYANDSIYNLMLHCWELEPTSRPSFNELQNELASILPNDIVRHFIGLNGTYMEWNTVEQTDSGTLEEACE